MNIQTYGAQYAEFRKCTISSVHENVIVFALASSSYETWAVSRMFPFDKLFIDSSKPFLLALKSFFKSDVLASVVCNDKYLWTVCLGNERIIHPSSRTPSNSEKTLRFYATPYFVKDGRIVDQYLTGAIRPAYDDVYFYKNTVLYLDNEDLPYPGGDYFDACERAPKHRICFLSDEPVDAVLALASEWKLRRGVETLQFMTRDAVCVPKFIDFRPVSSVGSTEDGALSTGIVQMTLSSKKPEHLIQDVLNAYYARQSSYRDGCLGLVIQWPLRVMFEGARSISQEKPEAARFVALSVNGAVPERVLHVTRPYERYVESASVPATLWTPVSFAPSVFLTGPSIRKVAVDGVVVGVVYRETFFCLSRPLLEGKPMKRALLNADYLLSTATFELKEDKNVRVVETFKWNNRYSLRRTSLDGMSMSLDAWCLSESSSTDPYPKTVRLPALVKQWTEFFAEVGEDAFDVDVSAVRLALMLSKHNICFHLNAVRNPSETVRISDEAIHFYLDEGVVQFVNDVRLMRDEKVDEKTCAIS